jgi:hypothetical protein
LIKLVQEIGDKDPSALVVLIGDHGPNFNKGCFMGSHADLNVNIEANGMSPRVLTQDYFEVFMAIKWPKGIEIDHGQFSHVNLFRHIFAAMSKVASILERLRLKIPPYLRKISVSAN